jgi:hypothetical protein
MSLNNDMKVEMQRPYFVTAFLFDIILPDRHMRLLESSGEVHYGEEVYRGYDDVFGSIKAVDPLQEQVGTEAPFLRIMFLPKDDEALAYLTDPARQGSKVTIHWAIINHQTGAIIGEPYLVFDGELDAAEADVDTTETTITMDVASAWELLFINGEGLRLNNAQHQRTWAERAAQERGFEFVVAIQRNEPWGYDGPRPAIVADTIAGRPPGSGGGTNTGGGIGGGGGYGGGGGRIGGGDWDLQVY